MQPQVKKKEEIKRMHYKVSWYKLMVKNFRNWREKDFRNDAHINNY